MNVLFFVLVHIAGIFFVLVWGYFEPIFLFLEMTAGFVLVCFLRNFVWRVVFPKNRQSWKQVFLQFLIFVFVFQVFLILIVPRSSFVPDIILENTRIIHPLEGNTCGIDRYMQMMKDLWGDSIDFDKVKIIQGGIMTNLTFLEKWEILKNKYARPAMTLGDTIYVKSISSCPTGDLYFHEMTHIWQFYKHRRELFGFDSILGWSKFHYAQIANPSSLYDYGGYYGLVRAKKQGKRFLDFNIEAQAMIVEHWYLIEKTGYVLPNGKALTSEYANILEYYVSDMLLPK